jgi:hypothetical protein
MAVAPVAGLSSSITSSASAVGSRLASPFASLFGQAASQATSGPQANSPAASAASAATTAAAATAALQQKANAALDAFRKQFQALLAANKIDASQSIQLVSDGQGGVDVAGDSPDAGQIKSLLLDHPDLVAQFTSLAQTFTSLRASDPLQANGLLSAARFGVTFAGQQSTLAFS